MPVGAYTGKAKCSATDMAKSCRQLWWRMPLMAGMDGYDRPACVRVDVEGCEGARRRGSRASRRAGDRIWFSGEEALIEEKATADGDRGLLIALDGHVAGKSMRAITEALYGAERVAAV